MPRLKTHSLATLIAALVALTVSCGKSTELTKAEEADKQIENYLGSKPYTHEHGVYHLTNTPSWGYQVNIGDTVLLWYVGQVFRSDVVFDTNVAEVATQAGLQRSTQPLRMVMGDDNFAKGLHNGLLLCRQGETAQIFCNPSYAYGGDWFGVIPPWSTIAYTVQVAYLNGPGIIREQQLLASLDLSGLTPDTSGMYIAITGTATSSTLPSPTDSVYAWFNYSLPNGNTLHSTNQPNTLMPVAQPLPALMLALQQMHPGQTATVIAPSPLCYGKQGSETPAVQPYQPLRFEIRLDSIKGR